MSIGLSRQMNDLPLAVPLPLPSDGLGRRQRANHRYLVLAWKLLAASAQLSTAPPRGQFLLQGRAAGADECARTAG